MDFVYSFLAEPAIVTGMLVRYPTTAPKLHPQTTKNETTRASDRLVCTRVQVARCHATSNGS